MEAGNFKRLLEQGVIWHAQGSSSAPCPLRATSAANEAHSIFEAANSCPLAERGVVGFNLPEIDEAFPQHGLVCGAIHEWAFADPVASTQKKRGSKRISYPPCSLLALLAGNALRAAGENRSEKFVFWVGRSCWPTPYLLQQTMHPISRCIFIDPPDEKLRTWAVETALRSPAVAAVVAEFRSIRFALSCRLALAAEKGGALGLFIRNPKELALPSAAASRWKIAPLPSASLLPRFDLELLKCKGPQPLCTHWSVEVDYGENETHETLSLRVPSDVAVRTRSKKADSEAWAIG
jgi:hypothetical protein